jgi:TolB-like protein
MASDGPPGSSSRNRPPSGAGAARVPWWRHLWAGVQSRFGRQLAVVAVTFGALAAAGHFVGGMLGWWHAYELTLGGHKTAPAAVGARPAGGPVDAQSLVMLPLVDESESRDADWFVDALTSDLTAELGRLPSTLVISRDTARTYKGKAADPRDVARELGVRYVVRGSMRRLDDRVRLDLQMVDGDTGLQAWSQRFEFQRNQLAGGLGEAVLQMGRSLNMQTYRSSGDRVAAMKPNEVRADDVAMQGWALYVRGFTPENIREGLRLFEESVRQDPRSTRGWGGVAFNSSVGVALGWLPDRDAAMKRLAQATERLRQIDENDFFTLLARVNLANRQGDWATTLVVSDALLERYPSHAPSHGNRGQALTGLGRFDECLEPAKLALRIGPRDPLVGPWNMMIANCHFMRAEYPQAAQHARAAGQANPRLPHPQLVVAAALHRDGQIDEARRIVDHHRVSNARYEIEHFTRLMPGSESRFVEGRQRMIDSLRELGMP